MSILLMAVISLVPVGAVGLHAGGIEARLGGVLVGVIALVSMVAIFVAVLASLGVGMLLAAVRVPALTVAPAGRKREGERKGEKSGEHRRDPVAVHGAGWSLSEGKSKRKTELRKGNRLPHRPEHPEVADPKFSVEVYGPEPGVAVGVGRVEEFDE